MFHAVPSPSAAEARPSPARDGQAVTPAHAQQADPLRLAAKPSAQSRTGSQKPQAGPLAADDPLTDDAVRVQATLQSIYRRLSRSTSSGKTINPVDGLRGVAITLVCLFHVQGFMHQQWVGWNHQAAPPVVARLFAAGHGVQLFFVISGFISALPFISQHVSGSSRLDLRRYYLRRLIRIEPPFLASLAFCAAVAYFLRHWPLAETLRRLGANAAYLHGAIYGEMSPLTPVAWSLEVQIQFYLLAPLFGLLFTVPGRWRRRSVIASTGAAFGCLKAVLIEPHTGLALSLLGYMPHFMAGFLLADLYVEQKQQAPHVAWDVVVGLGVPALLLGLVRWPALVFAQPLALLLLCHAALRGPHIKRILSSRPLMTLGGMSYSIYLLHLQLVYLFGHFTKHVSLGSWFELNLLVQVVLLGAPTFIVCSLFFVAIEKPCMAEARTFTPGASQPIDSCPSQVRRRRTSNVPA